MREILVPMLLTFFSSVVITLLAALGIAWGIRLGCLWLLRAIASDDELTEWLKQIFSKREE